MRSFARASIDVALPFRTTNDIDMILLVENRFVEFATVSWEYIKAGGYQYGWKGSDLPHFYRFTNPTDLRYPQMIELFSRRPDFQLGRTDIHLTPLHVSDDVSSLSAIMLDENYYELMLSGRKVVSGISVLGPEYLILFKAKAWLDLTSKKKAGNHVNSTDLKKHKNDVLRLYVIVDPEARIQLYNEIANDMQSFLDAMRTEPIQLRNLNIFDISLEDVLNGLKELYLL